MTAFRSSHSPTIPVPWLSVALLVSALVFSVYARLEGEAAQAQARDSLAAASDYLLGHPYLELPPVLVAHIDLDALEDARRVYHEKRVRNGWMETPRSVLAHQEAELVRRIETALADVPALPAAGVAVVAGSGATAAWLLYPILHVSNAQLVGSALLLLLLGVFLERSLGRLAFAATVTLAGAAAWDATAPASPDFGLAGPAPLLAGLLGAFALRFARRIDEGFFATALVPGTLWLALPPWAAISWSTAQVSLFATGPPPPPTAVYWAMLGAAGAGMVAMAAAWMLGVDAEAAGEGASPVTRSPQFRRAMRARAAGRPREAMELLSTHLAAEPEAYEVALALYEVALEARREGDAQLALLRVIRIEIKRELVAEAIGHWLELISNGIPEKADPILLIHMALLLREEGHRDEAIGALRCALERSDDRASHVVAARIARAARGLDPGVMESAAWRALGFLDLGLSERQSLENLIAEALGQSRPRRVEAPPAPPSASAPDFAAEELPAEPPPAAAPVPIEIDTDQRSLDAVLAVPLELGEEGIEIQTLEGQKKLVRYERVEAIAVAAVHGMAAKPVIVVDLVLNWMSPANETLRVIRLRGDRFDPRRLFPERGSAVDALRSLVETLVERSGGVALPDVEAALGRPYASYEDAETYHRTVLLVEDSGA